MKPIDAYVYHDGWVKSPEKMVKKRKNVGFFWPGDSMDQVINQADIFDFTSFGAVNSLEGTYPEVLQKLIKKKNWSLISDTSQKNFSLQNRMLRFIEKKPAFGFSGLKITELYNYSLFDQ